MPQKWSQVALTGWARYKDAICYLFIFAQRVSMELATRVEFSSLISVIHTASEGDVILFPVKVKVEDLQWARLASLHRTLSWLCLHWSGFSTVVCLPILAQHPREPLLSQHKQSCCPELQVECQWVRGCLTTVLLMNGPSNTDGELMAHQVPHQDVTGCPALSWSPWRRQGNRSKCILKIS